MIQILVWLIVVAVALVAGLGFGDLGVRIAGVLLQGSGIWVAFNQLFSKQRKLGIPTLFDRIWGRFKSLLRRRPLNVRSGGSAAVIGVSAMGGAGHVRPGRNAPVQDQIDAVWVSIHAAQKSITDTAEVLRAEGRRSLEPLQRGITQMGERIDELRDLLTKVTVGEPEVEIRGIAWIIAGIIIATFSEEIAFHLG